jgi:hypothetical protein
MSECFPEYAGIKPERKTLPSGYSVEVPLRYQDITAFMIVYTAPAKVIQAALPSDMLRPTLIRPGTAAVALTAYDYRQAFGVQPYKEFGLSVPVSYQPGIAPTPDHMKNVSPLRRCLRFTVSEVYRGRR